MKIIKTKILFVVCLFVFVGSTLAQNTAPKVEPTILKQKLQTQLDDWHKSSKFAGATLGVCLANGECFGLATGFSDAETKRRMEPDDLLMAGSVGKTYALAVAMQLVKEEKINLDDRVAKYFAQEKWFFRLPNAKDITVRQLMNHTSGLVRYEFKDTFTKDLIANPDKVWKPEELVSYLFDEKAPFEAGKGWDYSDTNYIVLGMIIEKVTGKKFYDLAQSRVIKPLKLKRTIPQDRPDIKGLVQGYAGDKNPFGSFNRTIEKGRYIINPQFEWTGGGWVTTAEDLAIWAKLMYEGRAFDSSLLSEILNGVPSPMLGKDVKYGLGVIIRPTAAGISYGHSGFFPGYRSDMMYFPDKKVSVAVQVNSSAAGTLSKSPGVFLTEIFQTTQQ